MMSTFIIWDIISSGLTGAEGDGLYRFYKHLKDPNCAIFG